MDQDTSQIELQKFGIGQPLSRKEDARLLQGQGRYTGDIFRTGMAFGVFVRSQIAHGMLRGIELAAARAMPGVIGIITGEDLAAAGVGSMPPMLFGLVPPGFTPPGLTLQNCAHQPLARGKVRFVGEPIALVVAETEAQARDAAEAVMPDIEPLPPLVNAAAAAAPGAPLIHESATANLAVSYRAGDAAAVEAAFAGAAHIVRTRNHQNRMCINAMEPRGAVGIFDSERYIIDVGCQGVLRQRRHMALVLGVEPEKVRVLSGNTGGSFGLRAFAFAENVAVMFAARALTRDIKWTNTRSEGMLTDTHAKDMDFEAELALDKDGIMLGLRVRGRGNVGAYPSPAAAVPPAMNIMKNVPSVYRTGPVRVECDAYFTNTMALGPYRGAGRPEANSIIEQAITEAARQTGIDAIELRRRNLIQPEQIPWRAVNGNLYDSGDFPALLDHALLEADWQGFATRRGASLRTGKLRGIGIGQYLESTGAPSNEMAGIRFDDDGGITITGGTHDHGQGHASAFAQVLVSRLGVPFERIRIFQGDSDLIVSGDGTGGSRSMMAAGIAISQASDIIIDKGRKIASHLLEAAEADIEFASGRFAIAGTDRGIGIMEMVDKLRSGVRLPDGVPSTLDTTHVSGTEQPAYPNGVHIAEVEIDPETGVTKLLRYTAVNDFGVLINPKLVEGQVHGGSMQGISQALMESCDYDENGQLITGSFLD